MDPRHPLAEIPDVARHLIDDDATALAFAVFYGLAGELGKAGFPATEESAIVEDHPTHWLLIVRFWGRPDPAENGWSVLALRKRDFSRFDAEHVRAGFHGQAPHVGGRFANPPEQN